MHESSVFPCDLSFLDVDQCLRILLSQKENLERADIVLEMPFEYFSRLRQRLFFVEVPVEVHQDIYYIHTECLSDRCNFLST